MSHKLMVSCAPVDVDHPRYRLDSIRVVVVPRVPFVCLKGSYIEL
jgi:hypothetical protein